MDNKIIVVHFKTPIKLIGQKYFPGCQTNKCLGGHKII